MAKYIPDSYCGIYCGACDILHAYKTGNKTNFTSFWSKTRIKKFHEAMGSIVEEKDLQFKCDGCKSDNLFINCRTCFIRSCAVEKKVNYCIDCTDYPCKYYDLQKKSIKILPHLQESHANLTLIKEKGVQQWLKEQDNRWKCPHCQTSFSWYTAQCKKCGNKIKSYRFTWFNALIFKLGIWALSRKKNNNSN